MLAESHERKRAMEMAELRWSELQQARTNEQRAGAIGRMRLAMDWLAAANIAERYALALGREVKP